MSLFSASSFGELAITAPFFLNFFDNLASKSLTITLYLLLIKLFASFPPTLPKPINPIFIFVSFVKNYNLIIYLKK